MQILNFSDSLTVYTETQTTLRVLMETVLPFDAKNESTLVSIKLWFSNFWCLFTPLEYGSHFIHPSRNSYSWLAKSASYRSIRKHGSHPEGVNCFRLCFLFKIIFKMVSVAIRVKILVQISFPSPHKCPSSAPWFWIHPTPRQPLVYGWKCHEIQ